MVPLDMTNVDAQKWMAARGKYDENNLVHRFRFWRFQHDYSLSGVSQLINVSVSDLIRFERGTWHNFDLLSLIDLMKLKENEGE